jgi:Na+-transporting methylmalonyl-CoA/oxaloacetate decarboxylase gamma subunit
MTLIFKTPALISDGITIAITGYVIVFTALVLLYFIFYYLSKAIIRNTRRRMARAGKNQLKENNDVHISGEVTAAIAMAIYLNRDLHDNESDILTIKKISKDYSPWSSKIYGMRYFRR